MRKIIIHLFVVLIVPPIVVPVFQPTVGMNNGFIEIDITTGRIRKTWEIWFATVWSGKIKDSELTKALNPDDLLGVKSNWKIVYDDPLERVGDDATLSIVGVSGGEFH